MKVLILLLFFHFLVDIIAEDDNIRTLYGYEDPSSNKETLAANRDFDQVVPNHNYPLKNIFPFLNGSTLVRKVRSSQKWDTFPTNYFNNTQKQLMVHWAGGDSNVIIFLMRKPEREDVFSHVYISYDYGETFANKTDLFKLSNGSYSTLEKFYSHPKYNTHYVFADVYHNLLYVTTNYGKDIKSIHTNFTPSDILFSELQPSVFVVLDKNEHKLWITEDFGGSFREAQDFVKAFSWIRDSDSRQVFVVERMEPDGFNSIIHSSDFFDLLLATHVKDFYVKDDYIFTTKVSEEEILDLYVSYKLGPSVKCKFDTQLEVRSYFIVDVTSNRALVAVSHSDTTSHLYVSGNLDNNDGVIQFTLSLEDVFCYFPNSTWHNTRTVSEKAFADVYKVEGLPGIYIASKVLMKPEGSNLGPEHLGSVITFDHGRAWRLIRAPERDVEGKPNSCSFYNNCSLHLSQKFSQLHPDTRSISILSSKSAPGIIMATGNLGKSLKGDYGVYISNDTGLTWRETLRGLHFFNFGDHGGILTAVKKGKNTRHILYSTDEGEEWKQVAFHNEDIIVDGFLTEPGENKTVFLTAGFLRDEHRWITIKLDLIGAFLSNCSKDDYKTWSPSQSGENRNYIPCVLGQQLTYQRRKSHTNCYNGIEYDPPVSLMSCECDIYDYECAFGFVRQKEVDNCVRNVTVTEDPYAIPPNCKPGEFYNRTKGYRKIQEDVCVGGFENLYLPEEIPCPVGEVQEFLLSAQRDRISRYNLVTKTWEELPITKLNRTIAVDYDMKNNCVYWADIDLRIIGRQCLNASEPEILVSKDLGKVEGIALDWISNNLYFVDSKRLKIELIRTDIGHSGRMRRTILGSDHLKKPRAIALHPKSGYMFWTDCSVENPSVNRADLDGSSIVQLFGSPKVEWPNGITIDYIAERIYWVDARKDYIASSDLHGDYFKTIVAHDDVVPHTFAIAIFKNSMYWDDWKRKAIFSADKDSFRGAEVLQKEPPNLMDLKVFGHGMQVGTNECVKSNCKYICVSRPKNGKSVCLCPDGMEYENGECVCLGGLAPFANSTCPPISNTCSSDDFTCKNGLCVPKLCRCDGYDDCGDSSDETQCGTLTCPPSYFVCGDGKCLPAHWKCDFDKDCADGSDEQFCPGQNCTKDQFSCNNGRCISTKWKCDGENDCRDGSDEQNCEPPEPQACKSNEFRCKSGGLICIPPTWKCDGDKDCRDGSDEVNCENNTCLDAQFSCGPPYNTCIYSTWVCDDEKDCPDGSDEKNCSTTTPEGGNVTDIFSSHTSTTVKPFQVTIVPVSTCGNNLFRCATGECIFSSRVCDGMEDCLGGEDESNCQHVVNCTKDQFKCRMDGTCVPLSVVCNDKFDCPDGTDEVSCNHNLPHGGDNKRSSE